MQEISRSDWRRLPQVERDRLRAEKHLRRAQERAARVAEKPVALPPPSPPQDGVDGTPFRDVNGRPLHLQNLYRGASVFLVLSGPSIRSLDLSLLNRRGVVTFGVNNSPAIRRVNIWTHVDPLEKFHNAIWTDPHILKIVNHRRLRNVLREKLPNGEFKPLQRVGPTGALTDCRALDMPGVIADARNGSFNPETFLSEPSTCWGVSMKHHKRLERAARRDKVTRVWPRCLNVFPAALKQCYSLGFRTVFLLGCDFNMSIARPYAFEQRKQGVGGDNSAYEKLNAMCEALRPKFEAVKFTVLNCNPQSNLRVFDFVCYEKAIAFATASTSQDPLDASGWYEK